MSAIPHKPNKGLLGHLDAQDRWEAEDMLIGLGMKYYGLISHTRVVDMYTLKQIYVKAMSTTSGNSDREALSTAAKTQALNALPPVPPAVETGTSSAILHESPTARYPFVDTGSANPLVVAPAPSFLSTAQPIKQKLAAKVFADLSVGRRGMRVQDIPAGLTALGLTLDAELVPAFRGRNQDMIISVDKWQTVVKRFVAREEAKQDTFLQTVSTPLDERGASESRDRGAGNAFREIDSSQFDSRTLTQRRQDFAAVFARYQRKESANQVQNDTTRSIADLFLKGPIGRELYEHEYSWNPDQENEYEGYNPNLREAFSKDSDEESMDAHDERLFLKALGMKVPRQAPYKDSVALRDAVDMQSHPAFPQTLQGVKDKFSKDDEKYKQREAARQAERDASSAEGWVRRKGGWVADFGPPKKSKEGLESLKASDDAAYDELYAEARRSNIGALSSETISMLTQRMKVAAESGVVLSGMEATLPEGSVSSGSTLEVDQGDVPHKKKHHGHHAKHGKKSMGMESISSATSTSSPSASASAASASSQSMSSASGAGSASSATGITSATSNTSTELTPKSQKRVDNMIEGTDNVTVKVQHSWSQNKGAPRA